LAATLCPTFFVVAQAQRPKTTCKPEKKKNSQSLAQLPQISDLRVKDFPSHTCYEFVTASAALSKGNQRPGSGTRKRLEWEV